jgi:hypothetical protein
VATARGSGYRAQKNLDCLDEPDNDGSYFLAMQAARPAIETVITRFIRSIASFIILGTHLAQ